MIAGNESHAYLPVNSPLKNRYLSDQTYPIEADKVHVLDTIELVLRSKAVILDNSFGMIGKVQLFREFEGLVILEEKYSPTYVTFFINKKVQFKKEILYL